MAAFETDAIAETHAGAILTIDLGAVAENYRRLRERFAGALCGAVVKADAYGLGAARVAPRLAAEGCRRFFVAHLDEGIALRAVLGPEAAIHVLNGLPRGGEGDCVAAGLVPVVNSREQLDAWKLEALRLQRRLGAVVQVDSGMARLGMAAREVEALAADPGALDGVEVRAVMSHLACADEPRHPANRAQLQEFERLRRLLPSAPASLANSSGIFLGSEWQFDIARPGVALYGVNPTPYAANPMLPVARLDARVIQTRELDAGAGVGYGHAFRTIGPTRTATIALGYADGWQRRNAAAAFLDGVRLPFIGRVSMDSIVLDISALPAGRLEAGRLVELIGPSQTVDAVAANGGTIGYEVLTSLGHRFSRRYVDG